MGRVVALAHGVDTEVAVGDLVSDDPAQALMDAARDGLITKYHGAMTGDRFELEILGRPLILPGSAVIDFVERLRAVAAVGPAVSLIRLVERTGSDVYLLEVGGHRVRVRESDVMQWCAGFQAARVGGLEPVHTGVDQLGVIVDLFTVPTLNDQQRMVILGLMHGRGENQVMTTRELAELTDNARKTVVDALAFGKFLAAGLGERMIEAFGMRWSLGRVAVSADGGPLTGRLPEMPGLVRLRRIVEASRAGWVRYADNPSPNRARWARRFRLVVGDVVYVVGAEDVVAWLDGVAAFHRPAVE